MAGNIGKDDDDLLIFSGDDDGIIESDGRTMSDKCRPWRILVVDDEQSIHDITRLALQGFSFEGRGVEILSAYSGQEGRKVLEQEEDIAIILLDVVMEEDYAGLKLVEFIRGAMDNQTVRIVLRTGQPGSAPEHKVISDYDINEYRAKPEFTAQRLYTSVTACLRAYENLKAIQRNRDGLEAILRSTSSIFNTGSFKAFATEALNQLEHVLKLDPEVGVYAGYFIGLPVGEVLMIAGSGQFWDKEGEPIETVLPQQVMAEYENLRRQGGERFVGDDYLGVFKTKDGFTSVLYLGNAGLIRAEEQYLLRVFARTVSIGFDNLSLSQEIINTQKEVVYILGEVVETRSQETAHHVTRVAEVCYILAKKCRMDNEEAELLRLASPMHDVGKIGIPEAILNKPGKLTDQEFEMMKNHARIGWEILHKSDRPIMKSAAITALQHHERWDGTGYPQGLAGENIHIYGRIAAIADVFDALSHSRCYKEPWPKEKIIEIFKKDAGTHFDPKLVDLFLGNLDEFYMVNYRFPE